MSGEGARPAAPIGSKVMTTSPVDINANLWNVPVNSNASVEWNYNSSVGLTVTVDF